MENNIKKVLIIDDNKEAADSLAKLLRHFNFEVSVVYDGHQAFSILNEYFADVILLDIGLPVMDGYEVAKRIRKIYSAISKKVLLVAVSGYGQEDDKKRSQDAGCDKHFIKPVDIHELEAFIKSTPPT